METYLYLEVLNIIIVLNRRRLSNIEQTHTVLYSVSLRDFLELSIWTEY